MCVRGCEWVCTHMCVYDWGVGVHVSLHLCKKRKYDVANVLKVAEGEECRSLLVFQIFGS